MHVMCMSCCRRLGAYVGSVSGKSGLPVLAVPVPVFYGKHISC